MLLGVAEDAVRAPDLVSTKAKMTELRLAGFTAVRVTSNWRPGLTAPTSGELGILRNIEAAARLSGVKVLVSVYSPGSATTPLDATAQVQFAQYAAALAQALPSFDDIIVGNEPNLNRFWLPQFGPDGSNASAPAYLSLLAQTYDALNYRDDQFDLSDALLASAIALLAVTALTRLWPLYFAALVPTFFGALMGVAGLAALPIHPDALVKLLS